MPQHAYAEMVRHAFDWYPLETGGIFLGSWIEADVCRVTAVIGPGPGAVHQTGSFEPDQRWQEELVGVVYEAGERRADYLGDWHTHPDGSGGATSLDEMAAEKIATYPLARAAHPVMVILACGNDGRVEVAGHRYLRGRLRPIEIQLIVNGASVNLTEDDL